MIPERFTVKPAVRHWDGLRVGDDDFIGLNAILSNDQYPRSKHYDRTVLETHIAPRGTSIGGSATILPRLAGRGR